MWTGDTARKMGAEAPTLFGAIKLLVNNQTAISEVHRTSDSICTVTKPRAIILECRGNHTGQRPLVSTLEHTACAYACTTAKASRPSAYAVSLSVPIPTRGL